MQAYKNEKYNGIKYSKPQVILLLETCDWNNLKHFSIEKFKKPSVCWCTIFFHLNIHLRNESHELLVFINTKTQHFIIYRKLSSSQYYTEYWTCKGKFFTTNYLLILNRNIWIKE